jgi:hypothetical protein
MLTPFPSRCVKNEQWNPQVARRATKISADSLAEALRLNQRLLGCSLDFLLGAISRLGTAFSCEEPSKNKPASVSSAAVGLRQPLRLFSAFLPGAGRGPRVMKAPLSAACSKLMMGTADLNFETVCAVRHHADFPTNRVPNGSILTFTFFWREFPKCKA